MYLLPRDITQLRLFHEEAVHREHFESGETVFLMEILATRFILSSRGSNCRAKRGACSRCSAAVTCLARPRSSQTSHAMQPTSLDTVAVSRDAFQKLLMHLPGLDSTMHELMSGRTRGDATSQKCPGRVRISRPTKSPRRPR
jgi:NADH:quinone reductase (non-electrogenic)